MKNDCFRGCLSKWFVLYNRRKIVRVCLEFISQISTTLMNELALRLACLWFDFENIFTAWRRRDNANFSLR